MGSSSMTEQTVVVVHQVECARKAAGHDDHASKKVYLDHPRLWNGDCRASILRGKQAIKDINKHQFSRDGVLLSRSDITVVVRTYHCESYHKTHSKAFETKPTPFRNPKIPLDMQPYFDVLGEDGKLSIHSDEVIHISSNLRVSMATLVASDLETFSEWESHMTPPYIHVYHTRQRIRDIASQTSNETHRTHLLGLLTYVESSFAKEYQEADNLFARGRVTKKHFAKLFGPNEVVVTFEDGEPVGLLSQKCVKSNKPPFQLECSSWAYDGKFKRKERKVEVKWPLDDNGPLNINELDVYPLRLHGDSSLENLLRDRGRTFWSCRRRNFIACDSPAGTYQMKVSNPRYMIDMETYRQLHDEEEDKSDTRHVLEEGLMDNDEPPAGPFVMLLPTTMVGFGMHDKKWRNIHVRDIQPIRWNQKAFQQLFLDALKKDLVEAMVTSHIASNKSTDVIEGKGNGLIILLHGGPGTGKTLTAESVAELAKKPLYRVTCGDIGTDPESVEKYLESAFYIATIWEAVLLLDESDVFLEQRQKTDLERNALVSVFLRALEYYEGIMILTSNRVGTFDDAFRSRMQLALYYPPLDEVGRMTIWTNFIYLLEEEQKELDQATSNEKDMVDIQDLRRMAPVLAKENFNGRQIRNVITTARQLARFTGRRMESKHVQRTMAVAKEFEDYVDKARDDPYILESSL